jgi:hypothetical protein
LLHRSLFDPTHERIKLRRLTARLIEVLESPVATIDAEGFTINEVHQQLAACNVVPALQEPVIELADTWVAIRRVEQRIQAGSP